MIDLFALNDKGVIVINRPEIGLYKDLAIIVERDIEARKSADITRQYIPFRELHYLYEVCDYRSYGNRRGMSDKELHSYAKEIARLDSEWKVDSTLRSAMERYKKEQDSIALRAVMSLRKSLDTVMKIASDLTEYNKSLYERMNKKSKVIDINLPDMAGDIDTNKKEMLTEFISRQKDIDSIVASVTRNIHELKNAEEMLKKEENIKKKGRGDINITESMIYD